nr:hypothetical protein [Tanacetum cinerariifolium]
MNDKAIFIFIANCLIAGKRKAIAVLRNVIALFRLAIGSSPSRNDGTVLEKIMIMIDDYKPVKELVKAIGDTKNDEPPLPEDFPTASEERFPLLRKRDATAEEDCTANEDKDDNVADVLTKPFDTGRFHYLVIVDFVEASHIRYALTINPTVYVSHIRQFWSTARVETSDEETKILATVDSKPRTIFESFIRRNIKLKDEAGISSLPDAELFENLTLMGYNISPNQKFTFQKGRTVPLFDSMLVHQGDGSGTPTEPHHTPSPVAPQSPQHDLSSSIHPPVTTATIPTVIPTDNPPSPLRQYSRRARIAHSSALPIATNEPTSPLGDDSQEMASKITAQDLEIANLKARIKMLEDKDGGVAETSREDATIKGRSLEIGEEAAVEKSTERGKVPTISVSIDSGMVPTASLIFTTASVVTPYSRRKGKEKMVESDTPMKREEELQMLIDSLDRNNETVAKYLQEYEQFAADLSIEERIELINDLGMSLEEIKENFIPVWKQIKDFVPMGSKEEGERFKRKGLRLEQDSTKKVKTSEEDLNQLWTLVKETLSIRQATGDKEKELWVELKRLYEPDVEDQL